MDARSFISGIDECTTPFAKKYFSREMMEQYQPLQDAMQNVIETDGKDDAAWKEFETHFKLYQSFDVFSKWDGKRYDIVMYGVSGYTGYLMMEYVKRVSLKVNPETFTMAFAGRTASKVAALRDKEFKGTRWADTPVLRATFDDIVSMADLARSARCIINVAGPYMLTEGEIMIDACCHMGTHYCDISGEIPWSLRTLELNNKAKEKGVFIVPSAASAGGYADFNVYMMAKKMRKDHGEELRYAEGYATGGGAPASASGGTLKTRAAMANAGDEVRLKMGDPFSLGGFIPDRDRNGIKVVEVEFGTGKVTVKQRAEERDANMARVTENKKLGVWRGPYVYQYFDTRIVRRANAMLADLGNCPYGRQLNYLEYGLLTSDIVSNMKAGGVKRANVADEAEALKAAGKYYGEGEGPPLEDLDDAWIGNFGWAQSTGGHEIKCGFVGRDGYFETARVAVETAMALVFDREKLEFKGGVAPPTVAAGTHVIKRIIDTGHKFQMGDWPPQSEWSPPPYP
jgi:short subunit dehydrogenase-like uncharacterized protein|mmetsp:Transcript_6961/g.11219  ORF Transcript_6961/g.11219 Transcript_6961/m.11219 type:complete len:513 (-) Transcript_6961:70-1608(-)|eukprot:CAMPEP_0169220408 /NCGR_PEP_ID=MMETSP1016-20121227/20504_1 /TAXON_ID=342587 /ORGANISM="Karlodinium micrum, Strain CCMP2283" /LENGTH=512 /DNA_ID=CAMNT_0009298557 /DNA_START=42 /DNA_END=1580 /DNA_ORIENTATION=-